jgi:hypothetical protein
MKLIFGFLLFVAAVAISGGLYLIIRKPEQKKTDLEKLSSVCRQIAGCIRRLDDYLARIYTSVLFRIVPSTRKGRASVPEKRSPATEFPHDSAVNSTV